MIYLELFATFFLIGLFTFGGGYAMIPLIKYTVVTNGWLTYEELVDFIGISESTPGPFAINIATFVGVNQAGVLGGICATVGVVLPSFIIILVIAIFLANLIRNKYIQASLNGIKPIVVGLILGVCVTLTYFVVVKNGFDFRALLILIIVFCLSRIKKIHPLFLILFAATFGLIFYSF